MHPGETYDEGFRSRGSHRQWWNVHLFPDSASLAGGGHSPIECYGAQGTELALMLRYVFAHAFATSL